MKDLREKLISRIVPKDTVYCYTLDMKSFKRKYCKFYSTIKHSELPSEILKFYGNEINSEFSSEKVEFCKLVKSEIDDSCKSCDLNHPNFE